MSADEVDHPSEEGLTTMAPKVPVLVYNQLKEHFGPAAKNVAHTGSHFLKSYKAFEKAHQTYCESIIDLIKSADSGLARSKHEADDLSELFDEYMKVSKNIPKAIIEFEHYLSQVADYSTKDKDNLKSDFKQYKSREKTLLSQKKKNKASDVDINEFYKTEATEWSRQQRIRYTYFKEKIRAHYIKMMKEFDVSKILGPEEVSAPIGAGVEVLVVPVEQQAALVDSNLEHAVHVGHVEHSEPKKEEVAEHVEVSVPVLVPEEKVVEKPASPAISHKSRSNTRSSLASTLEQLPTNIDDSDNGIKLIANRSSSISITPLTPVPLLPFPHHVTPQEQVVEHAESIVLPKFSQHTEIPRVHHDSIVPHHVSGKNLPGAVPAFGGYVPPPPPPPNHVEYRPASNTNAYRVIPSSQIPVGRVLQNSDVRSHDDRSHNRFPVESSYNTSASPSHHVKPSVHSYPRDVYVRSTFSPSQYGSILIVNEDYTASALEQLTVNKGDKVILLKCGVRGWSFVRDSVSGRTGWVPNSNMDE